MNSLQGLIGNTPLVKIDYALDDKVCSASFKAEWFNLSGSIKDRVALNIIETAECGGELTREKSIVEVTSGNMGISLAAVGAAKGYKCVIFMPKFMSEERKKLLRFYGAQLIETESFAQSLDFANQFAACHDCFLSHQFENVANVEAHRLTTAVEIAQETTVANFVAGVGTAGTLIGTGKGLKKFFPSVKLIAVEPYSSRLLSEGKSAGRHKIQGLADNFVPKLYDAAAVDKIISVTDDDALAFAQKLALELGLGVGISSGANFAACVLLGEDSVSVFPDDNKKYLSTDLATPVQTELSKRVKFLGMRVFN